VLSLLKYANREKIAQALTERGYSVKRVTVSRWAAGSEMPPIAEQMILELFGHAPDTKESLPPQWARGLTDEILTALDASGGSLVERVVERIEARLELLQSQDDGGPDGESEAPPDAAMSARPPRR